MRMRAAHRRGLALIAAVATALPLFSTAKEPVDARARLAAAREALAERALEAPAHVEASSWLDERGRLREAARITSRFTVPMAGAPALRVGAQTGGARAADPQPLCAPSGGLKRAGVLRLDVVQVADPADRALALGVARALASAVLDAGANDPAWSLAEHPGDRDSYERLLVGAGAAHSPYQLSLTVVFEPLSGLPPAFDPERLRQSVAGVRDRLERAFYGPPPERAPQLATLSLDVTDRLTGQRVLRHATALQIPAQPVAYGQPALPLEVADALAQVASTWWQRLGAAMACKPVHFVARPSAEGMMSIEAGSRAGLRVGDQLLVSDRSRIPTRVMEAGALERTAVFEVVRVSENQAVLAQRAGPGIDGGTEWFASPL